MFRRPQVRYGHSPVPVTPYQRAAQVWDDRIGSARVQSKNWRLAFFGCLALSGGLAHPGQGSEWLLAGAPLRITTVRGVGYLLETSDDSADADG